VREAGSTDMTIEYKRIIVPLDGSDLAELALPHAMSIAREMRRPIHLIRVIDIAPLMMVSPVGSGVEQAAWAAAMRGIDAEVERAQDYLKEVNRRVAARGVTVSWEVDRGQVTETLLNRINSNDLVTMTTHGRTGLGHWFFGSVAEDLLRRSSAPVLLIRARKGNGSEDEPDND
jgi:nucleotide-binding universal stress UspA family protein